MVQQQHYDHDLAIFAVPMRLFGGPTWSVSARYEEWCSVLPANSRIIVGRIVPHHTWNYSKIWNKPHRRPCIGATTCRTQPSSKSPWTLFTGRRVANQRRTSVW